MTEVQTSLTPEEAADKKTKTRIQGRIHGWGRDYYDDEDPWRHQPGIIGRLMHLKSAERWNKKNPVRVLMSMKMFEELKRECEEHERYNDPHRVADMEIVPSQRDIFDVVSEPIPDLEGYTFE